MGKSKKKTNNNINNSEDQYKISRKHLTADEVRQYKLMGTPDVSQNWLELFSTDMVNDLFAIMRDNSNNPKKAKMISKYMRYFGFEDVGLGTNIFVMSNPRYPGVVFKFALDDYGLADNYNDVILQDKIPRYARVLARHPSSIVTVQERKVVVSSQERMDVFRSDILKMLSKLSKEYLIVDLSPDNYLNYGIERNGDWCFIDASDLYPLKNIDDKIECRKAIGWDEKHKRVKYCGGRFAYSEDFSRCICSKCDREVLPLELRPEKNDKEEMSKMASSFMDGFSFEKRDSMIRSELEMVAETHKTQKLPTKDAPKTIFVKAPEKKPEPAPVIEDDDDDSVFAHADTDDMKNIVFAHDEDPDDTTDLVDELREAMEQAAAEVETEAGFDLEPRSEEPNIPASLDFDIIHDGDGNPDPAGIYITVHGDFDEAWEKDGTPIYVSIGDGYQLAMSGSAMKKILGSVVDDLLEEQAELNRRIIIPDDDGDEGDDITLAPHIIL